MKTTITAVLRVLLVVFVLCLTPAPVHADVAPPPIPLVGGLGTFGYQKTNVQMVSERVEMEVLPYPYLFFDHDTQPTIGNKVSINAWFLMHNTGTQAENMQVVFPLDDMNAYCTDNGLKDSTIYTKVEFLPDSFEARVGGLKVNTEVVTTDQPHKRTDNYCKDEKVQMRWAAFNVNFPADEDVLIRVSYLLDAPRSDGLLDVAYTLETGAAWKGPIGEATIVFRFPYAVDDFILPDTTTGYQRMQNEIYWRYENLEPKPKDNINVVFIDPGTWADIQDNRRRVNQNPHDDNAYARLARDYVSISHFHGYNIRSTKFDDMAFAVYKEGLKANPDSKVLNSGYVDLVDGDTWFSFVYQPGVAKTIRPFLEKVLQYEPQDRSELEFLQYIQKEDPGFQVQIGPAVTATPTLTATLNPDPSPTLTGTTGVLDTLPPTGTATVTRTPVPSHTPTASSTQPATKETPPLILTAAKAADLRESAESRTAGA